MIQKLKSIKVNILLIVIELTFFLYTGNSQDVGPHIFGSSSVAANLYNSLEALKNRDTLNSFLFAEKVKNQLKSMEDVSMGIACTDSLYMLSFAMLKILKDTLAKSLFEETIRSFNSLNNYNSIYFAKSHYYLSRIQSQFRNREAALYHANECVAIHKNMPLKDTLELILTLDWLAMTHTRLRQNTQAILTLEESYTLNEIKFANRSNECAAINNKIGMIYFNIGNYPLALQKLNESLHTLQTNINADSNLIAQNCIVLGNYYRLFRNLNKAIQFYGEAMNQMTRKFLNNLDEHASWHSQIGKTFLMNNQLDSAEVHFNKCIAWYDTSGHQKVWEYTYPSQNMANLYLAKGQYQLADSFATIAHHVFFHPKSTKSPVYYEILLLKGKIKLGQKRYNECIKYFNECISILSDGTGVDPTRIYIPYSLLGLTYKELYLTTKNIDDLNESLCFYSLAKNVILKELQNPNYNEDKAIISENARPIFENYIATDFLQQKLQYGSILSLVNSLELIESLRNYDLFLSTMENKARIYSEIPREEFKLDSLLSAKITHLENQNYQLSKSISKISSDSMASLNNIEINRLKIELKKIRKKLNDQYPVYKNLKERNNFPTINELRSLLNKDQTIVEYFTGDSTIYIFVFQKDTHAIFQTKIDFPLKESIKIFYNSITNYHTSDQTGTSQYRYNLENYVRHALSLCNKLIRPIENIISRELIIIPDAELSSMAFDALLEYNPKNLANFSTYPFLLRKHIISYAYSSSLFYEGAQIRSNSSKMKSILALAPFYNEKNLASWSQLNNEFIVRYGLTELPHSGDEVKNIQKLYNKDATVIIGNDANLSHFLKLSPNYRILHLATHAQANYYEGDFSFLAFAPSSSDGARSIINLSEINNLKLDADLVVLSACESGIGEHQPGIGIMSLSRGFLKSGCRSIVSSLWKVNDKSTMEIMTEYHKELFLKKAKNISLQNAKLNYLKNNPGQMSHPYFWSGFNQIGDITPMFF